MRFAFDYVGWRKPAYALSILVLGGAYVAMFARGGMNWGLDFAGGTSVVVKFDRPVDADFLARLREALGDLGRNIRTVGAAGAEAREVSIDVRGTGYVDAQAERFLAAREAGRLASPADLETVFADEPPEFRASLRALFTAATAAAGAETAETPPAGAEAAPALHDLATATPAEVRSIFQNLFNEGIASNVHRRLAAALMTAPDRPNCNAGDAEALARALAEAAVPPPPPPTDTAAVDTAAAPDLRAIERAFLPAARAVVAAREAEPHEGLFPDVEAAAAAAEASGGEEGRTAARLLRERFAAAPFAIVGTETVGPSVGADLKRAAITATFVSLLGLVLYVAWRFELRFAVAGVLCTFHDVLFIVGFIGATRIEFDIPIVAAILTVAGYSINDTIVIFDRIREKLKTMRREPLETVVNAAIAETLVRSLMTGVTTMLAVIAFYFLGPSAIRGLNVAILAGIVVGTYSSIFVAAPLLVEWEALRRARAGGG